MAPFRRVEKLHYGVIRELNRVTHVKEKKDTESFSRRNAIEENEAVVEETYQTLLDKHGQKYDTPMLRL